MLSAGFPFAPGQSWSGALTSECQYPPTPGQGSKPHLQRLAGKSAIIIAPAQLRQQAQCHAIRAPEQRYLHSTLGPLCNAAPQEQSCAWANCRQGTTLGSVATGSAGLPSCCLLPHQVSGRAWLQTTVRGPNRLNRQRRAWQLSILLLLPSSVRGLCTGVALHLLGAFSSSPLCTSPTTGCRVTGKSKIK